MAFPNNISLCFCLACFMGGCDSGSTKGDNNSTAAFPLEITPTGAVPNNTAVLPLENTPIDAIAITLDARQLDILDEIKQRAADDGALYQFDDLNPVFVQQGDSMNVTFEFINPTTIGGSPVVEYSLTQNAITSIVYTQ